MQQHCLGRIGHPAALKLKIYSLLGHQLNSASIWHIRGRTRALYCFYTNSDHRMLTNRKRLETGRQLTLCMHSKATAKSTSTTHVEAERISLMMKWGLMFSDVGQTYLLGTSISLRQRQSFYTGTEPKTQAGLKSWKMRRYFHLQASFKNLKPE